MPSESGLLESLIRDAGARWSITVFVTTLTLMVLQLANVPRSVDLGVVAIVATIGSAGLSLVWRIAAGLVGWALLTGFAYNRFGELTFSRDDMTRMAILLGATSVASSLVVRHRAEP